MMKIRIVFFCLLLAAFFGCLFSACSFSVSGQEQTRKAESRSSEKVCGCRGGFAEDFGKTAFAAERRKPSAKRIVVLDMDSDVGVSNRFGCASVPLSFVRALGGKYDVRVVHHSKAVADGAFDSAKTDLLIIPSGSLFPCNAAGEIVGFLKNGGLMITVGGYAFDEPMAFVNGKWQLPGTGGKLPPPVVKTPILLPSTNMWRFNTLPGTQTVVDKVCFSNGCNAVKISTPSLIAYNLGVMPVSQEAMSGANALCFCAKADGLLKKIRIEITERDGSRWRTDIPASTEWKDFALSWDLFEFHPGSPTRGKRGGEKDRVRFSDASDISFGVTHGGGNVLRKPHSVWISNLASGNDAFAEKRSRIMSRVRINTRDYPIGGKGATPRADQIGVFSPAYRLKDAMQIKNDSFTADLFPVFDIEGIFSGWDASAMLTPKVSGHARNSVAYRPLLVCHGADGVPKGRAACLAYHYDGVFKGSSWALFGIDNYDLFQSGKADKFLCEVVDALFRRIYLAETKPQWACWYPGETAKFETTVKNFSASPVSGKVVFSLSEETGNTICRKACDFDVKARSEVPLSVDWPVPPDAYDFYRLEAVLELDGKIVDREQTAIAVWKKETIANGPKVGVDGNFFTVDGRRQFLMGAQVSVARQLSHTSGSALRFYDDFKLLRKMGMTVSRNFFMLDARTKEPERTRIIRLIDACVLLSQKFKVVNYLNHNCDNAIALNDSDRQAEADLIAAIAERYKDVPGFMMDVRNEPRLYPKRFKDRKYRSPRDLSHVFAEWSKTAFQGARRGNKSLVVATGFCQGWGNNQYFMDPPTASMGFDFTDAHYYGSNEGHIPEIKKIDHRILGKPAVMGEFGCYFHPMRWPDSNIYKSIDEAACAVDAEAARRYRCQAIRTFGCGYALACNYGWADLIEGDFTFALCHWDGNPRPIAKTYSKIAQTFSRFTPVENPPDTVLLVSEKRLSPKASERDAAVGSYYRLSNALAWWGVNFSVLPESEKDRVRPGVKLVLSSGSTEELKGALESTDETALRTAVGKVLRSAGVGVTRNTEKDPDSLETYRVPGEGSTAWLFWNGDEKKAVTVKRDNHQLTIGPERGGYLQVSDGGKLEVCTEL